LRICDVQGCEFAAMGVRLQAASGDEWHTFWTYDLCEDHRVMLSKAIDIICLGITKIDLNQETMIEISPGPEEKNASEEIE